MTNMEEKTEKLTEPQAREDLKHGLKEKSFAERIDEVLAGTVNQYNSLKVCDTPQLLLDVGCEQLPMLYTQRHLRDALKGKSSQNSHWHGLTVEQIKSVPALLEAPAIIFDSLTPQKNSEKSIVVVLNAVDNDNIPLNVSELPKGEGIYNLKMMDSNFITSIYGKDKGFEKYIVRAIESNSVLYWDKIKSQELFMFQGLQLPKAFNNLNFNKIIHQSNNIVNSKKIEERKQAMNEEKEQIVKLTGLPVSEEMRDILQRLASNEDASLEEIDNTEEIKTASSCVDYSVPTMQLSNRFGIREKIYVHMMEEIGSAAIDENGKIHYNETVEQGSRLDIVIGLPASGKSSAIVDVISQEFHSKVIDNDMAKEMIPQFNDGWGAGVVHEESQLISDRVF